MDSQRLPGKMMVKLNGYPILEWVVKRSIFSKHIDEIVIATSNLKKDDIIAEFAKNNGVNLFRGSEKNVLGRFAKAANKYKADIIVRICADNPFIDAREIDRLINFFNKNKYDYACNHRDLLGSNYADGFGAEILSSKLINKLNKSVKDANEREHVTLHILNNQESYRIAGVSAPKKIAFPKLRFDIDNIDDLERMKKICSQRY